MERSVRTVFAALPMERHCVHVFERYRDAQRDVRYLRWQPVAKYHITLLYVGDIDGDALPVLLDTCADAARMCEPYALTLSRIGYALPERPADMVWAYWDGPPAHAALVERVGRACAEAGIVPADQRAGDGARPHIPHTTLARFCNDVLVRELRSLPRSGLEREHLVVDRFALWETLRNGASGVCRVLGSRRLAR